LQAVSNAVRDLEGIIAKWKAGPYRADARLSSWLKIKNPKYSHQAELFDRRQKAPRRPRTRIQPLGISFGEAPNPNTAQKISSACARMDRAYVQPTMHSNNDYVPITGKVLLRTSLGAFLEIEEHRVFIPSSCMLFPFEALRPGEMVTLRVLQSYAIEQGFDN
jgi:hypothetical protein